MRLRKGKKKFLSSPPVDPSRFCIRSHSFPGKYFADFSVFTNNIIYLYYYIIFICRTPDKINVIIIRGGGGGGEIVGS